MNWITRNYYRLGLGISFMQLMTFLSVATMATKYFGFRIYVGVPVLTLIGIFGAWLFGYVLDRFGFQKNNEKVFMDRMPITTEHMRLTKEIHDKICK